MNIFDYLEKNKNKTFRKLHFNEADALIFSALAYFSYEAIKTPITYIGLLTKKEMDQLTINTTKAVENFKLISTMKNSKRYRKVLITLRDEKFSKEIGTQFSAVCFRFGLRKVFIAYRGTDNTILGWKENLMMGYLKEVPAQTYALEFFNKCKKRFKHSKLYLAGHSKGGNLAEFAALKSELKDLKKIEVVYNFDGPGFIDEDLLNSDVYKSLSEKNKLIKVIPEDSVVGKILNNEPCRMIKSNDINFEQHNLFNWQIDVETGKFINGETQLSFSKMFESIFNEWYYKVDKETVKDIIDCLIAVLKIDVSTKLSDLVLSIPTLIIRFLKLKVEGKGKKKKVRKELIRLYLLINKYNKNEKSKQDIILNDEEQ